MSAKNTILLVDDDADWRSIMCEAISASYRLITTHEASSGGEALDYLHCCGHGDDMDMPILICLDIDMSAMSGLEVLKAVKSDPTLADIPVMMLTGQDDPDNRRIARDNGADIYVLKSQELPAIVQAVWKTVKARGDARHKKRRKLSTVEVDINR